MLSEIDDGAPHSCSLGSIDFVFSDDDVVHLLKAAIEREGSQSAFAKRHGFDRPTINAILKGRRPISSVLKALQLRKVYVVANRCEVEIFPKSDARALIGA
jgi:hypothetical protein